MKNVVFKGAAKEVGRSGILVETDSERILMDYGLKPLPKGVDFPKLVKEKLDAILLSHGHLDHLGALPILYNNGQSCYVFGKEITSHFARLLLTDSLKISKQEGYSLGYRDNDIKTMLKKYKSIKYRKTFNVGKTKVTAFDAGHISGSCMFLLEDSKRVLYTGDFRLSDTRLIKGADIDIENVNVMIIESTYSDREHPEREKEERRLMDFVESTLSNDGVALISAFAISRSQELLMVMDEYEVKVPVYMDGMSADATEIIIAYPELQREYNELKKAMQRLNVQFVNPSKRKKIIKQPCIIITGSGMLEGGPVIEYIKRLHDNKNCSLSLTGFQVPGTSGYNLLQTGKFSINGNELNMQMNVKKFDFSSHASRSELFKLAKILNPEKIFCIHGEKTEEFAKELKEEYGFDAISPDAGKPYPI